MALVHAALIFEHAGLGLPLANALSMVAPGGLLSVVLQLPSEVEHAVASTGHASMRTLKHDFTLLDPGDFRAILKQEGLQRMEEKRRELPGGKALWMGIFGQ